MLAKSMGYFNQSVNSHNFLYSGVRNFVKLVTSAASNVVLMKELKSVSYTHLRAHETR